MGNNALRIRRSILELQNEYESGNKKPLEDLMRAWKGVKELSPDDPNSFFKLGGFHGEPFRGGGWGSNYFWGGYCNHGNILFPTWHRVYCLKIEQALQSIPGCDEVMLPYWDETDDYSLKSGIPWALTNKEFELDGISIPNPLKSFVFPVTITDNVSSDDGFYSKPKGYETVRYPLSGLVGSDRAVDETKKHNSQYPDYDTNVKILNNNVTSWLNDIIYTASDGTKHKAGVRQKYIHCLNAPNYTVFSNTTSAQEWNQIHGDSVVPLESPHNDIHLSVGGYDVSNLTGQNADYSLISDANGDMGENDTAALDPIFYFHHCNVDRVFWLWQKRWGKTDKLDVIPFYPGTNSSDNQGATPGIPSNVWLNLKTELNPFTIMDRDGNERIYTSLDCINIETQLGFSYSQGSLENLEFNERQLFAPYSKKSTLQISGINKASIKGSFVLAAFAFVEDKEVLVGFHSVLSRWATTGCANCQTHLEVKAAFDINTVSKQRLENIKYVVKFMQRNQNIDSKARDANFPTEQNLKGETEVLSIPYKLEIRVQ